MAIEVFLYGYCRTVISGQHAKSAEDLRTDMRSLCKHYLLALNPGQNVVSKTNCASLKVGTYTSGRCRG